MARTAGALRMTVAAALASELRRGESVAVNGVCLTVTASSAARLTADVSPQTARVTTLARLRRGSLVNLERPMDAIGRVGGHFVLGHVDATGALEEIREDGNCWWIRVSFPPALAPYLVPRGSVAVDGISLTVARLRARSFDVQIVPFTWDHTNLRGARRRDRVNLECDILGKYVVRALEVGAAPARERARRLTRRAREEKLNQRR